MEYWETIFRISIFCLGLRAISDDGMVLFPLRKYFIDRYERFDKMKINIAKPIILCCTCMSSVWGTQIWWGTFVIKYNLHQVDFHWYTIPVFIASIISCSFINWLGWSVLELVRKY